MRQASRADYAVRRSGVSLDRTTADMRTRYCQLDTAESGQACDVLGFGVARL
jgi:hypothetical protein